MEKIREISLRDVRIADDFWTPRQQLMTDVTIPYMEKILRDEVPGAAKSHALRNFAMAAGEETGTFYGMVFQDSDVAKWLEAAAYSLALKPDARLEARVDEVVALIARAQQADGYLNTYFTVREPQNRWTNLLECHELYCAGHMLEAAVALHEAVGKDELLGVAIRLADHIIDRFAGEERLEIPGHQEIEIGLMRLYRATGNAAYRDLALAFLDRRGRQPDWFLRNTPPHPDVAYGGYPIQPEDTAYNQSDVPVRDQTTARGHAVRLVYMLTAMADAAASGADEAMKQACERMFDSITQKQMYVTGVVGASAHHEAFTTDYDLPADRCYGETCASVAMAFFARKMLGLEPDGRYADLLERELYNAALAGMQLDGRRFFYVNPLEVDPRISGVLPGYEHVLAERPQWHSCACCPPNLARLIASLGGYLWSESRDTVYSHLFVGSTVHTSFGDIELQTRYPWDAEAAYTVRGSGTFRLAVRIPAYAQNVTFTVAGQTVPVVQQQGYAYVAREWRAGDCLLVRFDMPPQRVYADPRVRDAAGKVALVRGPLVYCVEGVDNGAELGCLRLPKDSPVRALPYEDTLGGIVPLEAEGLRLKPGDTLYAHTPPQQQRVRIRAVPYYAWSNRGPNEMRVWIAE